MFPFFGGTSQRRNRANKWHGLVSVFLFFSWVVLVEHVCLADIPSVEVAFEWKGGHIVVQGSIGELEDLNLVIDTGASSTVISQQVANELSLRGKKKYVLAYGSRIRVEQAELPSVEIGALRMEEVPTWIVPQLSVPDARQLFRMDGVIGLDFLRRTNLTIDYESQIVRFGPIKYTAVEPSPYSEPFYANQPFIVLSLSVQGQRIQVALDSGAEDLILYQDRVQGRLSMRKTNDVKVVRHCGGKNALKQIQLSDVVLGEMTLPVLNAYLMDGIVPDSHLDGVLGIRALGLKKLSVDFHVNRISLE